MCLLMWDNDTKETVKGRLHVLQSKGIHVFWFMSLYATGDMTRRVSAPSETEEFLNNKTVTSWRPCSSDRNTLLRIG